MNRKCTTIFIHRIPTIPTYGKNPCYLSFLRYTWAKFVKHLGFFSLTIFLNKKKNCLAYTCKMRLIELFLKNKAVVLFTLVDCRLILINWVDRLVGYV